MREPDLIYVEEAVANHPVTARIIERNPAAQVIRIEAYTQLFHRQRQSFRLQKEHPALILARSHGPFLYEAPQRIRTPGAERSFYTDQWRNCLYDCDYCFLQGMHPSAYPVIFVNAEDYHRASLAKAAEGPLLINTSFLTDALSFESLVPTVDGWMDLADEHAQITIEVRTKSNVTEPFLNRDPLPNVRAVWTLSPEEVSRRYERGCAPLEARIEALSSLSTAGWRPGVAMDPIVLFPGWQEAYRRLIERLTEAVDPHLLAGVSYGVFRMATGYLKTIRQSRADSPLLYHPFARTDGLATYGPEDINAVHSIIGDALRSHFGEHRVSFVHG